MVQSSLPITEGVTTYPDGPDFDLRSLEQRAFGRSEEDGLTDVLQGFLLLSMVVVSRGAVSHGTTQALLSAYTLIGPITIGALAYLHQRLQRTRVGTATRRVSQRRRQRHFYLAVVGVGVVVFLVANVIDGRRSVGQVAFPFAIAIAWVSFEFGTAIFKRAPRFFAYGLLMSVGWVAFLSTDKDWRLALLLSALPAAVMICVGLVLLVRFLRRYPLPQIGELPDGRS